MKIKYLLSLIPFALCANPQGEQLSSGDCKFSRTQDTLTITQNSDKAIINWKEFSITKGETTRFVQPHEKASVLNRVTTDKPSKIYGTLEGNGRLYLINQNGIVIGPEGRVKSAGFIASTLNLSDYHFLNGKEHRFTADSDAVFRNEGSIDSSGDIYLIARTIEDTGRTCSAGNVHLLAGTEVLLFAEGDKSVVSVIGDGSIDQKGLIEAVQVELRANGRDIKALAINQEGVIHATGVKEIDGQIILCGEEGTVSVKGDLIAKTEEAGGTVHILGGYLQVHGDAFIDASGDKNGGTLLIGGDYKGQNPAIRNATAAFFGSNAIIDLSSKTEGNGGKVIIWSDESTSAYGKVFARGGANGGDGGFVEISSKGFYEFRALVDTTASQGKVGTLLLDPPNIDIGVASVNINFGICAPLTFCTAGAGNGTIDVGAVGTPGTLLHELSLANVFIDATVGSGGSGAISFTTPFTWVTTPVGGSTLTLNAADSISVNAGSPIANNTTNGNIVFNAPTGSVIFSDTYSATGATLLEVNARDLISIGAILSNTNAGATFNCFDFTNTGAAGNSNGININANITTMSGNIFLQGQGGNGVGMSLNGGISHNVGTISSSSGSITLIGISGTNAGGSDNFGYGSGVGTIVTSVDGDVSVTGTGLGGTAARGNDGITMFSGAISTTGSGSLTVNGTGSRLGMIEDTCSITASGTGSLSMTCTGSSATGGFLPTGLHMLSGAISTASGPLNMLCSSTSGSGYGIWMELGGSTITAGGGPSMISATGTSGIRMEGGGANFNNSSTTSLTITGTGGFRGIDVGGLGITNVTSGTLSVVGIGGLEGVSLGASIINMTNGTLNVTGTGTTGVVVGGGLSIGGGTSSGAVTVTADTMTLGAASTITSPAAGGTVTIQTTAAANSIGLGTSVGTLSITNADIAKITAANTVTYGRADQAIINVGGATLTGGTLTTILRADTLNVQNDVNGGGTATDFQIGLTGGGTLNLDSTLSGAGTKSAVGVAAAAMNTIIAGLNTTNTWNLTGADSGDLVTSTPFTLNYTNIGNLVGGTMPDTFVVAAAGSLSGSINGGSTGNTLDYSGHAAPVSVDLTTGIATAVPSFSNLQNFIGNAPVAMFTLAGPLGANTWNITANDAGNINGAFTFSSFGNLVATLGDDTFVFADGVTVGGGVDGGSGTNTLDLGAYTTPVTWNITSSNTGNVNGTMTFTNIQNLTGGSSDDTFIFADQVGVSGQIDGGGPIGPGVLNELDYTAFTTPAIVDFLTPTSGTASNIGAGFININSAVGNWMPTPPPPPPVPPTPAIVQTFFTQVNLSFNNFLTDPTQDQLYPVFQLYLFHNGIRKGSLFLDDLSGDVVYVKRQDGLNPDPANNFKIRNNEYIPSGLFMFFSQIPIP